MTLCELYEELKGWQSMIGSILGFAALTWGALYNYKLNRRRDDETRAKEALSVALGLYSEITLISKEWPAAGLVDTEIGCFHLSEVHNAKKEVQPRVQA